jgi:hypothetical protein
VKGRDGPPHDFRQHGSEDQVIFSAQDDDFRLRRQHSFEALSQGHSSKTAAHNYKSFRQVCFHDLPIIAFLPGMQIRENRLTNSQAITGRTLIRLKKH